MASSDYDWEPDDFGPEDWEALLPDVDQISEAEERWGEEERAWEEGESEPIESIDAQAREAAVLVYEEEERWKEEEATEAAGWHWREEAAELKREQRKRRYAMAGRSQSMTYFVGKFLACEVVLHAILHGIPEAQRPALLTLLQRALRDTERDRLEIGGALANVEGWTGFHDTLHDLMQILGSSSEVGH